jgi:acyl carrier protein
MDRTKIVEKISDSARSFFGDGSLAVTEETSSEDIKDWDSVSHIQLVFEIEEMFNIQFDADDIPQLTSVSAIADKVGELLDA